jgi:tetratricopeptide (TPR) repeat protein
MLLKQAQDYYDAGDYNSSERKLTALLEIEPDDIEALKSRAVVLYVQDKIDDALSDLNKIISLKADYAEAFFYSGLCYHSKKNGDQAIRNLSVAINLSPKDSQYYNARGIVYYATREFFKAIDDFTTALKVNPRWNTLQKINSYDMRGYSYYELGEYKKAIDDLTTVIKLDPPDKIIKSKNCRYRGYSYYQLGEHKKAINDFTAALDLNMAMDEAEKIQVYYGRGSSYYKLGEYKKAIDDFTIALKSEKRSKEKAKLYNERGASYHELAKVADAIKDVTSAIIISPDDITFNSNRAFMYFDNRYYEEAINDFEQVIKLSKKNNLQPSYDIYEHCGITYYKLEQYESAVYNLSQAIDMNPNNFIAYDWRAVAYQRLKKYKEAIQDYDHIIGIYPETYKYRAVVYTKLAEELKDDMLKNNYLEKAAADMKVYEDCRKNGCDCFVDGKKIRYRLKDDEWKSQ